MKLNIDCVRDVMLWAEDITTPTQPAIYVDTDTVKTLSAIYLSESEIPTPNQEQLQLLSKYSNEELVYHLRYCITDGLLAENNITSADTIIIKDLTPLGHDFIANVREEENYNSLKSKAKRAGVESVKALITIGEEVAASAITKVLTAQG